MKNRVEMVDVGGKKITKRRARAYGRIRLSREVIGMIRTGEIPKGDPIHVAKVAAIMAAKRTAEVLPLTHNLPVEKVSCDLETDDEGVAVTTSVSGSAKTGFEMEAMLACSVALLTIYDMVKSLDRGAVIEDIYLLEKSGGRSGKFKRGHPRR